MYKSNNITQRPHGLQQSQPQPLHSSGSQGSQEGGDSSVCVTGVLSLSGARGRKQSPSTKRALLPQRKRSRFSLYQEPEEGAGAVKQATCQT